MAELPSVGKAPVRRRPSQLRHELHADSTDDEKAAESYRVEAPDSQTTIPETQIEHQDVAGGRDAESEYGDDGLSPRSVAVLKQCATKKDAKAFEASSFAVKLLTKENLHAGSSSRSAPSVGFCFGQPKKAVNTTPTDVKSRVSIPVVEASSAVEDPAGADGLTREGSMLPASTSSIFNPLATQQVPLPAVGADAAKAEDVQRATRDDSDSFGPAAKEHDGWDESHVSGTPPSAQPSVEHAVITKKNGIAKKGKRKKKAQLGHSRGVPWPPRSASVGSGNTMHPLAPGFKSGKLSRVNVPSSAVLCEGAATSYVPEDVANPSKAHLQFLHEDGIHASPPPADVAVWEPQPEVQSFDKSKVTFNDNDRDQQIGSKPCGADNAPGSPCILANDQHSLSLEQHPNAQPTPVLKQEVLSFSLEQPICHQDAEICFEPRHTPLSLLQESQHAQTQSSQSHSRVPQASAHASHNEPLHYKETDNILEDGFNRGGPYRVEKTQKKKRAPNPLQPVHAPPPIRARPTPLHGSFEQTLESLRIAHLAEQHRTKHDRSAETKHFEEVKSLLQDQITHHSMTAAEWKDKHQNLSGSVSNLREKAKTNQKFVSGLQKDYEKLQKSAVSFQNECKRVLQHKIAEIESEKEALRHECERALDALARGQKSLKVTVDDLYVMLTISQSKRKDLAESLDQQVRMYEEEKAKRSDLEKQILASVQGVGRQIDDRTTVLVEKLVSLQAAVHDATAGNAKDSAVQDCLAALRKLQVTPFLTTKDVQKAEGMLRFVQEDFDGRLDALVNSIQNQICSTGTMKAFITEGLRKLRTEILDFDRVTAESRQAQQTSDILRQQLEAEQEHTQGLQNQINALEISDEALNARKVQLEKQLAEIHGTTETNDAKSSGFEQELAELRQQVKLIDAERSTASTASNDNHRLKIERDEFKKQLELAHQEKMEGLQTKDKKINELERTCAQLENSNADLQVLFEQQQGEISQHPCAIEALRQEIESERIEERDRATSVAQIARNEIIALQRDQKVLREQLGESQDDDLRLKESQNTLLAERDALRSQNAELRAAQEAIKDQILRIEEESEQKARDYEESVNSLREQQDRANAALKEAEAKLKREDAEHQKKLDFDRKKFESTVQTLLLEVEKSKATTVNTVHSQQQAIQLSASHEASSRSVYNSHSGSNRKKVNRHNNPVLGTVALSGAPADQNVPSTIVAGDQNRDVENDQMLFGDRPNDFVGSRISQDDIDRTIRDPVAEQVAETQEIPGLTFDIIDFNSQIGRAAQNEAERLTVKSTDVSSLSIVNSDELDQLQEDSQPWSPARLSGHNSASAHQPASDNMSNSDSLSLRSQDRPRSQANTASRMMPPPEKASRHFNQRNSSAVVAHQNSAPAAAYERRSQPLRRSEQSSPDFMHSQSSVSRHTYAEFEHGEPGRDEQAVDKPHDPKIVGSQKRNGRAETGQGVKRMRTSSTSLSNTSSELQSDAPFASKPSADDMRSRFRKSSTQRPVSSARFRHPPGSSSVAPDSPSRASPSGISTQSRNKLSSTSRSSAAAPGRASSRRSGPNHRLTSGRQTRSKTAAQEDRFEQELRGR